VIKIYRTQKSLQLFFSAQLRSLVYRGNAFGVRLALVFVDYVSEKRHRVGRENALRFTDCDTVFLKKFENGTNVLDVFGLVA